MWKFDPDQETIARFSEEFNQIKRPDLKVLRTHLYAEYYIDEIFSIVLERGETLEDFRFIQKVQILKALNILSDELIENLEKLNSIRNDMAHNIKVDEVYQEKVEPRLKNMNWLDEEAGQRYKDYEDGFTSKYAFKLILTVSILDNFVSNIENRE